jgi:hypothetical protein
MDGWGGGEGGEYVKIGYVLACCRWGRGWRGGGESNFTYSQNTEYKKDVLKITNVGTCFLYGAWT